MQAQTTDTTPKRLRILGDDEIEALYGPTGGTVRYNLISSRRMIEGFPFLLFALALLRYHDSPNVVLA